MAPDLKKRLYLNAVHYDAISQFLVDVFEPTEHMLNWMQPRWEYMHAHPFIAQVPLDKIAVFEDQDQIVGVAHPEEKLAFVYFQRAPGYDHVLPLMFDHADRHFGGRSLMLERDVIGVFIGDFDKVFEETAMDRGYELVEGYHEGYSRIVLDQPIPKAEVPRGIRIHSLEKDNDHNKINKCLWSGFNHEGDIPEAELDQPAVAQSAPNFRPDLTMVAVAPNGDYVSYAGMWHEQTHKVGYVEPVATNPDYRRLGLARALVTESLRRIQADGAESVWVASDQEFYLSLGFEKQFQRNLWVKYLD